jgi:hypothetical protein
MLEAAEAPNPDTPQRKLIDKCPFCGSRLLFVEGVTHYVSEVEIDENGAIYKVGFADGEQVPYHRTTWLECDENCADSKEWSIEDELFGGEEGDREPS